MNEKPKRGWSFPLLGILVITVAIYAGYTLGRPASVHAQNQNPDQAVKNRPAAQSPSAPATTPALTNAPAAVAPTNTTVTNAASALTVSTNASTNVASTNVTAAVSGLPPNAMPPGGLLPGGLPPGFSPDGQPSSPDAASGEDVQLSFQNANIEMIVQWLAKYTGKSVLKHPRVQCQLSIVSSKKVSPREGINLVYRALSLEGFTVIESSTSILIVPDGSEPKMIPELVKSEDGDIPEGRQRLIRIFQTKHVPPADIRERIKSILSEKSTVEIVERANQLIVTDYNENLRLAQELITELDVPSSSDVALEFFPLKHAEAEEIMTLLTQILNAQSPPPSSSSSSSSGGSPRPSPGSPPPGMPGGMPPGMSMPSGPPPGAPPSGPTTASSGGGTGQVKIWPDKTSNRLIVAAPKAKMTEISDLLEILDTPKTKDVTIRVIPVHHVSAEDLVREISPMYQRMASRSAKDQIEITANGRSNSLIVLSSADNFEAIQKLVASLDREEAQEKALRTFQLHNADAEEVAKQLQDLNEDKDANNRYPYYISFSQPSKPGKKNTFVADRRRNTIVVQAPQSAMADLAKVIEALDAPIDGASLAPKIFRLRYVSATDIEDVLNELFLKKQQQRTYWDPYSGGYYGNEQSRDSTGGKLYGKVRITSEPYSNSIIVTSNSPEGLAAVEEVLKQLDSPSQAGETTMRVILKFARATTVASSLNILFAKGGSPPFRQQNQQPQQQDGRNPQQPNNTPVNSFSLEQEAKEDAYFSWLGGQQDSAFGRGDGSSSAARPVSDLVGRVRVVPDRRSNSILITGNLHFFPQVLKLISELDEPTPQVLIEAKIIEVSSDFRDKLGVRWSPDGRSFSGEDLDDSLLIKGGASYREVFAGSTVANSLRSGVLDSSVDINVLVQFLRKNANAKVLAEPQLNVADNELGKLFVGSQVPFISGSINTVEGGRNDTFQYRDVGVILEVTPHINTADEVALKIRTESSSIRSGETLFGAYILDSRNFKTDLMVKNGETIVLGGIIQREQSDVNRKVPGLGSVPGLGWAFRKKDKVAREVELMVFLRPRITRTPEQARELLQEVERKLPLIKAWEVEQSTVPTPEDAKKKSK